MIFCLCRWNGRPRVVMEGKDRRKHGACTPVVGKRHFCRQRLRLWLWLWRWWCSTGTCWLRLASRSLWLRSVGTLIRSWPRLSLGKLDSSSLPRGIYDQNSSELPKNTSYYFYNAFCYSTRRLNDEFLEGS